MLSFVDVQGMRRHCMSGEFVPGKFLLHRWNLASACNLEPLMLEWPWFSDLIQSSHYFDILEFSCTKKNGLDSSLYSLPDCSRTSAESLPHNCYGCDTPTWSCSYPFLISFRSCTRKSSMWVLCSAGHGKHSAPYDRRVVLHVGVEHVRSLGHSFCLGYL